MKKNERLPVYEIIFQNRFIFMLVFILMLIAIQPFDEVIGKFAILLDLITTGILVSAIFAISLKKSHTLVGVLLAAPFFVFVWANHFYSNSWIEISSSICGMLFFVFIIMIILTFIFNQDRITKDLIGGAAVVYLLMAITWTFAYRLIEIIHPGSFSIAESQSLGNSGPFLYYSFVTLTTLGYGDIFPTTSAAKSCAILEAVIAQLYLVITVARLVGVYIQQSWEKKS